MFMTLLKRSVVIFFKAIYFCHPVLPEKPATAQTWQKGDRIMLCAASGIGDAIMALPVITRLQQVKPDCRIGVVCRVPNQTLFSCMNIDVVLHYDLHENQLGAFFRLAKNIRHFSPHVWFALRPSNTLFHTALAMVSGAAISIRHALPPEKNTRTDMAFVYTHVHPFDPHSHQIQNNLNLVKYFQPDIAAKPFLPRIKLNSQTCTVHLQQRGIKHNSNLISIHAGGNQADKRYPPCLYARIINILMAKGYTILLLGGKGDRNINQKIKAKITREKYLDLSGELELMQTAFVLNRSKALITNDSGIMHLADILNRPLIALFSPTDPKHVGPINSNAMIINHPGSIEKIKVDEIIACFEELKMVTHEQQ